MSKVVQYDEFVGTDFKLKANTSYIVQYKGKNGTVFHFHVDVGSNVDDIAAINWDGYGSGCESDGAFVDDYLDEHKPNCIDIRFRYGHDGYKYNGYDEAIATVMKGITRRYGVNSDNSMIMGFSSTGDNSIRLASEYAKKTGGRPIVVAMESSQIDKITRDDVKTLIDHDAIVLNAYTHTSHSLKKAGNTVKGLHRLDLEINFGNNSLQWNDNYHVLVHRLLAQNGITDLSSGNFDFTKLPSEFTFGDHTYKVKYTFTEYYTNEKGEYTSRDITPEQANALFGTGKTLYFDMSGVTENDIIESDNEFLSQGLSVINSLINKASTEELSKEEYDSTTNTPSGEPAILSKMLSATGTILEKLQKELVAIGRVGNSFATMDNFLKDFADNLNMAITNENCPRVDLIEYESKDPDSISIPADVAEEIAKLKEELGKNSEDHPFVEDGQEVENQDTVDDKIPEDEDAEVQSPDKEVLDDQNDEVIEGESPDKDEIEKPDNEEDEVPSSDETDSDGPMPEESETEKTSEDDTADEEEVPIDDGNPMGENLRNNISKKKMYRYNPGDSSTHTPPSSNETLSSYDPVVGPDPEPETNVQPDPEPEVGVQPDPGQTVPVNPNPTPTPSPTTSPTPTPVSSTTGNASDDSVREIIKPNLEEILPKVSDKKEKTPIIPSKIVPEKEPEPKPVTPVEPVKPAEEPVYVPPAEEVIPDEPIDVPIEVPVEEPAEEPAEEPVDNTERNKMLKTIGIASGLGAGIGAMAYGINNQMNKRETRDGFGYSYEKEERPYDFSENETYTEQYTPYSRKEEDEEAKDGDE